MEVALACVGVTAPLPSRDDSSRPAGAGSAGLDDLVAARLIQRYQGGDVEAFVLLDRYRASVFNLARSRLGSQDDADDVTQQVFFKALQALRSYRPAGRSFRRWLLKVAKNTAEDHARHAGHSEAIAPDDLDRWIEDVQRPGPTWGNDDRLHELVAELSEAERQVLVLLYRWNLTPRETAIALGRPEAAVYKVHARTLAKLRAKLSR